MYAPFPLVRVEGSPRDRGLAYGRAAAERIAAGEELYREAMGRRGFDWSQVQRMAADFRPTIEATDADCMAEIDAIAEGAGIDVETVIVVNARSEIFNGRTPEAGALEGGCTSGLALSHATTDSRLLHAQNWDFNAACIGSSVVLHLTDEEGHSILTFVEAGGLARSGLNTAGIAITANNLESELDVGRTGMPLSMIRRRALMARTFADAIGAITSAPRAVSNNMTLSHAGGDIAINFETTPDDVFVLYPQANGLFAHANHFNAPEARVRVRDGALNGRTPCTLYRDKRVMHHLAADAPNVTRATFERALSDDFGHPFAVCRPPVRSRSGHLSTTVASVIFDAGAGALYVRPAPWDAQTQWATHTLDACATQVAAQ